MLRRVGMGVASLLVGAYAKATKGKLLFSRKVMRHRFPPVCVWVRAPLLPTERVQPSWNGRIMTQQR